MRLQKVCKRCRKRQDAYQAFVNRTVTTCSICMVACEQLNKVFDQMFNAEGYLDLRELDDFFNTFYGGQFPCQS